GAVRRQQPKVNLDSKRQLAPTGSSRCQKPVSLSYSAFGPLACWDRWPAGTERSTWASGSFQRYQGKDLVKRAAMCASSDRALAYMVLPGPAERILASHGISA